MFNTLYMYAFYVDYIMDYNVYNNCHREKTFLKANSIVYNVIKFTAINGIFLIPNCEI